MVHRLLQIHSTACCTEEVRKLLADGETVWWREHDRAEDGSNFSALVEVGSEQELLDALDLVMQKSEGSRLLVLAVEATLPRIEEPVVDEAAQKRTAGRISREELRDVLAGASTLSWSYVAMVLLAAGVVIIGLVRDSAAVVIGGMVLAPLLGPNIALAFAAILADGKLAGKALKAGLAGMGLAFAISFVVGLLGGVATDDSGVIVCREIRARTEPHVLDLLLAMAAGVAGAMSFTTALTTSLVGVMVAVALMPPLAVCGMCMGAGQWDLAEGAAVLLLTNLVCVDLAAVCTFLVQAIKPRDWWDVKRSQRVVRIVVLVLLLAVAGVSVLVALRSPSRG
jgi:uncharacterized hydrophobic protein (TIGR00341 family)